jgi:hypothetical protein
MGDLYFNLLKENHVIMQRKSKNDDVIKKKMYIKCGLSLHGVTTVIIHGF